MNINFLLSIFDYDDTIKIIIMYVNLAEFTGDEKYMFLADKLIRELCVEESMDTK